MSEDQFRIKIAKNVDEMHLALLGSDELGIEGVVGVQKKHSTRISSLESNQNKGIIYGSLLGGVIIGSVIGFKKFVAFIFGA